MTLGPSRPQSNVQWLLAEYARTGRLPAISGGSGEGDGDGDKPDGDKPDGDGDKKPKVTFTDEQQAEINRIVAREAKAARDKAAQAERDRIKAEQDADDEERKRQQDEAKGEYEKVKGSLITERDTLKADLESVKGERDTLLASFMADYEAVVKVLEPRKDTDPGVKALFKFKPADDASLAQKTGWFATAKDLAAESETTTTRGNGPNPKPGDKKIEIPSAVPARGLFG